MPPSKQTPASGDGIRTLPGPVNADTMRGNSILAALPDTALAALQPALTSVVIPARQILYDVHQRITHVYFPLTSVASLLTLLEEGNAVEAAAVGRDGMVGLPLFLGLESDVNQAINQIPGACLRLPRAAFLAALKRDEALQSILQRYTQSLLLQMSRSAACIRQHPVEGRCARWLLHSHDRVGLDQFQLTQDFLATMLGVRRASVTVAAGMLQRAGFIRYQRGRITILNRPALEASTCDCYAIVTAETTELLGPLGPSGNAPSVR